MKPKVDSRQSLHGDTIHVNIAKAEAYLRDAGVTINTQAIKTTISRIPGANVKFRSRFTGANQDPCLKIPRRALEASVLDSLDKGD